MSKRHCLGCGVRLTDGSRRRYCDDCLHTRRLAAANASKAKQRAAYRLAAAQNGQRKKSAFVPRPARCVVCGTAFTQEQPGMARCPACNEKWLQGDRSPIVCSECGNLFTPTRFNAARCPACTHAEQDRKIAATEARRKAGSEQRARHKPLPSDAPKPHKRHGPGICEVMRRAAAAGYGTQYGRYVADHGL